MKSKNLEAVLERVETWPELAQEQLAEIVLDIEHERSEGYRVTAAERAGIERGLAAVREGRFATDEQVEAALAKFRNS